MGFLVRNVDCNSYKLCTVDLYAFFTFAYSVLQSIIVYIYSVEFCLIVSGVKSVGINFVGIKSIWVTLKLHPIGLEAIGEGCRTILV